MESFNMSIIENLYKEFTDGMAKCEMNYRLSEKIIKTQQIQIKSDYKKLFDEQKLDVPITTSCLSFYRWKDNLIENYEKIDITLNSLWDRTIYYHNKLYQWQLVTAFEYYEKYLGGIIKIFCCNPIRNNFHAKIKECFPEYKKIIETKLQEKIIIDESQENPSDGLISYQQIEKQELFVSPFDCFSEKTIKEQFIQMIVQNNEIKEDGKLIMKNKHDPINYDHDFSISLIEQLRHVIVHNNGIMQDKDYNIQKILERIGKYNNGNYDQVYNLVLNAYLNSENEIQLLEIPVLTTEYFTAQTTVLRNLFSVLLNSGYYIFKEIEENQSNYATE